MDESTDLMKNLYLKVEIDNLGSMIAFETTIPEFIEMHGTWMEKNWFEDFISPSDQSILRKEYTHLFEDGCSAIISLKHDILTPDQQHFYMNFDPILKVAGEKKSLLLLGNEYYLTQQTTHRYHPTIRKIDDVYFID